MVTRPIREVIERTDTLRARPEDTVLAAATAMAAEACGSILVMKGEQILGIFTERDLLTRVVAAGRDLGSTRLGEVMTRDPDTVGAEEPIAEAIRKMDEFSYRYLPVIEDGQVIGVISARHLPFSDLLSINWELEVRHRLAECMR